MSLSRFGLISCRPNTKLICLARHCTRRSFSVISEHRVFPATLMRLNVGRDSNLYPRGGGVKREQWSPDDAVTISDDGLVRQHVDLRISFSSNGVVLMPNTFLMQELIRMSVDGYFEDKDAGLSVEIPMIFTFAKGTQVPNALSLLREGTAQFSLQPREPMTLAALNDVLVDFYRKHGKEEVADEWLDGHEYHDAVAGNEEEVWMAM